MRPDATPASMDSTKTPAEEGVLQARWTDFRASMAESALSSRVDAPWAERGVDATAVGVGADAVDAALDGLADVEAAADGLGEVDAMADLDATAGAVAAVEALPAPATLLPLAPHPASAARTTTNAAGARGRPEITICIAAVCQPLAVAGDGDAIPSCGQCHLDCRQCGRPGPGRRSPAEHRHWGDCLSSSATATW